MLLKLNSNPHQLKMSASPCGCLYTGCLFATRINTGLSGEITTGHLTATNVDVSNDLVVQNDLTVYGQTTLNDLDVSGDVCFFGTATFKGDVVVHGDVDVSGEVEADNFQAVTGAFGLSNSTAEMVFDGSNIQFNGVNNAYINYTPVGERPCPSGNIIDDFHTSLCEVLAQDDEIVVVKYLKALSEITSSEIVAAKSEISNLQLSLSDNTAGSDWQQSVCLEYRYWDIGNNQAVTVNTGLGYLDTSDLPPLLDSGASAYTTIFSTYNGATAGANVVLQIRQDDHTWDVSGTNVLTYNNSIQPCIDAYAGTGMAARFLNACSATIWQFSEETGNATLDFDGSGANGPFLLEDRQFDFERWTGATPDVATLGAGPITAALDAADSLTAGVLTDTLSSTALTAAEPGLTLTIKFGRLALCHATASTYIKVLDSAILGYKPDAYDSDGNFQENGVGTYILFGPQIAGFHDSFSFVPTANPDQDGQAVWIENTNEYKTFVDVASQEGSCDQWILFGHGAHTGVLTVTDGYLDTVTTGFGGQGLCLADGIRLDTSGAKQRIVVDQDWMSTHAFESLVVGNDIDASNNGLYFNGSNADFGNTAVPVPGETGAWRIKIVQSEADGAQPGDTMMVIEYYNNTTDLWECAAQFYASIDTMITPP